MGQSNEMNPSPSKIEKEEKHNNPVLTKNLLTLIKSNYNFKTIFKLLDEKKKLKIITYNNKLRKKLGINKYDYKKASGKIFVGERNGKGEEYDYISAKLIFEGKYLNGKRNGRGNEYFFNGKLKFEGQFLNGKRVKGKEYNDKGLLIFNGKYLNGKWWNGKIKEYYGNGKLKFDGELNKGNLFLSGIIPGNNI